MPTPTQAQLALERDALKADIADKLALYNSMIAKGQVNSAQELLGDINKLNGQELTLSNDIKNFTQFSAERASQDAEIAQTQNFETKNSPANQIVTSKTTTSTTTGGTETTTIGGAFSLTPEAKAASKNETLRAQAFNADPTGRFGPNTIDRAASSGAITAGEAAALRAGAIPEAERNAIATAARQASDAAAKAGTIQAPTTTTVTPTPNSSGNTTVEQQSVATPPPSINSNSNLTNTATIVTNPDGTKSEVTVNNTTATVTTTPIVDNQLVQGTETTIVASQNVDNTNPEVIDPNNDPNIYVDEEILTPVEQQPISIASDPNTNIGTEGQDFVFEPLQEPPITNDGDEFSGIDEQVQRQKDLEDGSLEFAGIDEQIALNENTLQEPPLLSDEEIEQQLRLAAAQEETITSPDSITENVFDPRQDAQESVFDPRQEVTESVFDPTAGGSGQGISTALNNTRSTATKDDSVNFKQKPDWRARLSLAPNSNYLYNVPKGQAGILAPLQGTDGVIFPYTPAISVTYSAGYDASELIHSNYKVYQYKGSSVDTVSITADFTAQDTPEANYLLAVIHFFRSVTKMFYGQDQNPNNGVPPPLCYLSGFGAYTFDAHPLVVTNFTYSTPTEVDYIRAGSQTNQPGVPVNQQGTALNTGNASLIRIAMSNLKPPIPNFSTQNTLINSDATYVPTKLQLQITCIPIVTRNDISNKFSLKEYATGALLRGSKRSGGGIW